MRIILALVLSIPIYMSIEIGWSWVCLIGLQILAGLNVELGD